MSKIKTMNKKTKNNLVTYLIVIIAYIVFQALSSSGNMSNSLGGLLVPICAYIVMAVSLNLTVGIMGELSLGHAGFMSIGAFSGVITAVALQYAVSSGSLRLLIAIVVGGIMAGIVGLLVSFPVLRLRGDYLAIVTLALGEIIKNLVYCLYVGVDSNGLHFGTKSIAALGMGETGVTIVNGPMGAVGIPKLSTFFAGFLLVVFCLFMVLNFINSRSGRAVMALRDNRIAAESVGVSPSKYKATAFVISAILAGMAGTLYALNYSTVAAKKFDFNTSILVLVFVVLGGIGNIRGSIITAVILTVLPELLRAFSEYRMLIYAILLILIMIIKYNPKYKLFFVDLKYRILRRKSRIKEGDAENG